MSSATMEHHQSGQPSPSPPNEENCHRNIVGSQPEPNDEKDEQQQQQQHQEEKQQQIFTAGDYNRHFDVTAYLEHFYSNQAMSEGLRLMLFVLPNIAKKIEHSGFNPVSLLDVGSGPTIYVALCFRNLVKQIHLADYAEQSCLMLRGWQKRDPGLTFDWTGVCQSVAKSEGMSYHLAAKPALTLQRMEDETRAVVDGIYRCDVLHPDMQLGPEGISLPESVQYDIVTTVFCLESACTTFEEYKTAMKNVVARVKPGGYFIIGSVEEDYTYEFAHAGREHRFTLLYLTEAMITEAMDEAGLDVQNMQQPIIHAGAIALAARKRL